MPPRPALLALLVACALAPRGCDLLARVTERELLPAGTLVLPERPTVRVHPTPGDCRPRGLGRPRASVVAVSLELDGPAREQGRLQPRPLVLAEQLQRGNEYAGTDQGRQRPAPIFSSR